MANFNLMQFAGETRREIAKVSWPSRRETVMTTVMVIVMALVAGAFFFGVDGVIGYAVSHILGMGS